ncbi:hypothetical protein PM082_006908 [Marasmius tenuissimus]|nr:hypothetical protein PM082_006908 [Marasmius tenuissimus]
MASVYLLRHNKSENQRFYIGCTTLLFLICTLVVVNTTIFRTRESSLMFSAVKDDNPRSLLQYVFEDKLKYGYYILGYLLPALSNVVAEAILIHRCYMVWGQSKVVAIPLAFFSAMGTVLYIVTTIIASPCLRDISRESQMRLYLLAAKFSFAGTVTSTIVNVVVAGLTAWRIWRMTEISRTMQPCRDTRKGSRNKFSNSIRIILESAALYPFMAILQLALVNGFNANGQAPPFDLTPVVVISAGISSSLALTRAQLAKLSRSTDSVGGGLVVSDIQFDLDIPESSPSSHPVVDIRNNPEAVGSVSPQSPEIHAIGRSSLISPDPNDSRNERMLPAY